MSNAIRVQAPAKLNLTLEVIERLPNGYHNLRSIIVRLRHLADAVRVQVRSGETGVTIRSRSKDIPLDETNICHAAATRFLHHADVKAGVDIAIDKAIPVAAGLGGGSSDAAAVLIALNRHFGRRIPPRKLSAIGFDVGSDIPFFLTGARTARVCGMGQRVRGVAPLSPRHFLIVNPRLAVSTKEAYAALAPRLWFMDRVERADRSEAMVRAIRSTDIAAIAAALYNDFEIVVERTHPIVKEVKQALLALGASGALMTGSGPTVFGLFRSTKTLMMAQRALEAHYPSFVVARA